MKNVMIVGLSVLFLATGCSKSVTGDGTTASSSIGTNNNTTNPNGGTATPTPSSTIINNTVVVCDPMDMDQEALGPWNGLKGTLSYDADTSASSSVDFNLASITARSTASNVDVFMSELNVPTQLWTKGFSTTGGVQVSANGNPLLEWFKLSFDSKLRLASYDEPGLRQFAIIADDGAVLSFDPGTGLSQVVNGDGLNSSKLSCGTTAVWMGHEKDYPIHLDYFQGPRNQIALMVLWRKIPDEFGTGEQNSPILDPASLKDSQCGLAGNGLYFDFTKTPSAPTAVFEQMRARGWEVVPAINYIMPGQEPNPCANGVYSNGSAPAPAGT